MTRSLSALLLLLLPFALFAFEDGDEDSFAAYEFDDALLDRPLGHPRWFKESLLDLEGDLEDATASDRKLVVYFGQKHCAYCKTLMRVNWSMPDIVAYTRAHFDVVPVDIWSTQEITTPTGETLTAREYSVREKTNFTPSLLFYDENGRQVFKLRGYYPPYKFRAALEYVTDEHYKRETFADYLDRAQPTMSFEPGGLNDEDFFAPPPHALDRSRFAASRPLMVFFEQGECHACDVLHGQPLQNEVLRSLVGQVDSVQLDVRSDAPVITPDGKRTSAKQWARDLELFYYPTIIFFDERGKEIIRVDSVVRFYRLANVMRYVISGGYREEPNFLRWRSKQSPESLGIDTMVNADN